MAENPLSKLARLAGGAAMLPGSLGYKVLGQLLISRSTGTELAGANVVLAAVSRQTNAIVQVAVRSMVPAVVVEAVSRKEQRRLERMSAQSEQKLKALVVQSAQVKDEAKMSIADELHQTRLPLEQTLLMAMVDHYVQRVPLDREPSAVKYLRGEGITPPVDSPANKAVKKKVSTKKASTKKLPKKKTSKRKTPKRKTPKRKTPKKK